MKIAETIDKKAKEIFENFEKDKEDLTGWSLRQAIREESRNNKKLGDFILYKVYQNGYEKNKTIPLFLSHLIEYMISSRNMGESKIKFLNEGSEMSEFIEIFPKIGIEKDILIKILRSLGLDKTIKSYGTFFMVRENEMNQNHYFSEEQVKRFKKSDEEVIDEILDIFHEECREKGIDLQKRTVLLNNNA